MYRIPTILSSNEILDKAFKKVGKVKYSGKLESSVDRINSFSDTISSTLMRYVKAFPSIDDMHPFYLNILDIKIGRDRLKKALSSVMWASRKTAEIASIERKNMNQKNHWEMRKKVYGRISSLLKGIDGDLKTMADARKVIKEMSVIRDDAVKVVIAGHPNVGKSTLLKMLSTAAPKIASYPFTTKGIIIGEREEGRNIFQFIDTPGLLDRDMDSRNNIEKQAVAALRHVSDILIFMLDPTESCGYPMKNQEHLLREMRKEIKAPLIVVETKADIIKRDTGNIRISAVTGEGVEDLMERIREISGTLRIPERP